MLKDDYRQQLLARRSSLSDSDINDASARLCHTLSQHPALQQATVIASYQANKQEINPAALTTQFPDKQWVFPRIHGDRLVFAGITDRHPAKRNSWGILEPTDDSTLPLAQIDVMLVPLLAFDKDHYRLGYGAGYYDRTLAKTPKRPLLLGLAYDWQQVDSLPKDSWDIPLDNVIIA